MNSSNTPTPALPSTDPATPSGTPPPPDSPRYIPPSRPVLLSRHVAVLSTLALIALGLAWELWLAPLRPGGSWWALKVLPLALPLAGLLKNRMYTYRWLSLLVWLYMTEALMRVGSDSGLSALLAAAQAGLCLVLFTACAVHVRWRLRAGRQK